MAKRFKDFVATIAGTLDNSKEEKRKICVLVPQHLSHKIPELNEAKRKTIGNYTARKDQPHFQGDQYHAHCTIPGGYEVSWNIDGTRRHKNKFPSKSYNDAKQAVAAVLGVSANILEAYTAVDEETGEEILLFEVRDENL